MTPPGKHYADTRMLAQQQVRLLAGMTRLLSRLLHSLLWEQLRPHERRRALLLLARLEHDLALTRVLTRSQPMGSDLVAPEGAERASSVSRP